MQPFAELVASLEAAKTEAAASDALTAYFAVAPQADWLWAIALLSGQRPRRIVTLAGLLQWVAEATDLPLWLLEASGAVAGDPAETVALVLPPPTRLETATLAETMLWLEGLRKTAPGARPSAAMERLGQFDSAARRILCKLATGSFRVQAARGVLSRALSQTTGAAASEIAHRLAGAWSPQTHSVPALLLSHDPGTELSRPFPFHPIAAMPASHAALGRVTDWHVAPLWDGPRCQLILRGGDHFLWSGAGDFLTAQFPELARALDFVPEGTVLEGHLLPQAGPGPEQAASLEKRMRQRSPGKQLLATAPVVFCASDLLEWDRQDLRGLGFAQRRGQLRALCDGLAAAVPLRLDEQIAVDTWAEAEQAASGARALGARGVLLRPRASPYNSSGRRTDDWRAWPSPPLSINAVLVTVDAPAAPGAGKDGAALTFAVWAGEALVPVAQSGIRRGEGLSQTQAQEILAWVAKHTLKRFGPARAVAPELVFTLEFAAVRPSARHRSGLRLQSPLIARWRQDVPAQKADTLAQLQRLLVVP